MSAREALAPLWQKVDTFFKQASARHPQDIQCHTGCSDCCVDGLSVTELEARAISELLAEAPALSAELSVDATARQRHTPPKAGCVALDLTGRCRIYQARPLVCRSHGVIVKLVDDSPGRRSLPVLDTCPRNFRDQDLTEVDPASVLDQRTLSTILLLTNQKFGVGSERVDLVDLFASTTSA